MSDNIMPYYGGAPLRDTRRASRAISRHNAAGHVRVAAVDVETDVTIAKVDAVTMATGSALASVVRVAQAQKQLELLSPEASGRLNFLAESHAMAMGDLMQDLRRDLRRR